MGRLWGPRARPGMTFVGPSPPASVVPVHIGKIDSPTPGERFVKGSLTVRGWTCFSAGPVSHAEVFLGDETLGSARVGVRRSDVAATIDYPYAGFSGFELTLTTEAVRAVAGIGDSEVRVLVEGLAGRTFWPEPVPIRLLPPQSIEELLEPDLGNIDTPAFGEEVVDTLRIEGWACFPHEPVRRVEIWLGEEVVGRARVGVPRPDLQIALDRPHAALAGFELTVSAEEAHRIAGPGRTEIRAVVTSTGGRTFELAPVAIKLATFKPAPAPEAEVQRGGTGRIDLPLDGSRIVDGTLSVRGWAAFPDVPTRRAEVFLDGQGLGHAQVGLPRPDLASASAYRHASLAGFELTVSTEELRRIAGIGDAEVRVVATAASGEEIELTPVTVRLAEHELAPAEAISVGNGCESWEGRRTLVVTHKLTLGGAQLFLMDLLHGLRARQAIDPIVVSSVDGPLRSRLEAEGVPVHITDLRSTGCLSSHRGRIEEFLAWAPSDLELVLVNTATSAAFAGGEIASELRIPSVWTIHESFEPALLWADLAPEVRAHAQRVIGDASLAIFEADATRSIYERLIDPSRCLTVPYGVDLDLIDVARAAFDRKAARGTVAIPADARLVVCIGTVEPRKAQVPLVQAFRLIAERHPDVRLAFIGGKAGDPDTVALEACIERASLGDRIALFPITPDVDSWYGMSDLLVCASDVESLPRTVLEAMAWETPVLATSVFGLPELIEDGETGWLCEPRDISALADALDRALSAPAETRRRIARNGRRLIEWRHSLPRYAERVAALMEQAIVDAEGRANGAPAMFWSPPSRAPQRYG